MNEKRMRTIYDRLMRAISICDEYRDNGKEIFTPGLKGKEIIAFNRKYRSKIEFKWQGRNYRISTRINYKLKEFTSELMVDSFKMQLKTVKNLASEIGKELNICSGQKLTNERK